MPLFGGIKKFLIGVLYQRCLCALKFWPLSIKIIEKQEKVDVYLVCAIK